MLYQLSYEGTDVGSRSIVGSYVPMKEMSVNKHMNPPIYLLPTLCLSQRWDKHNVDWVPSLNLGKKRYRAKSSEVATERAERAKARRKSALEQQQAKKMTLLNESGPQVVDIRSTLGDI